MVQKLWLHDTEELVTFLKYADLSPDENNLSAVGREMMSLEFRQQVYNYWQINSETSVHRSNGRHIVKVSQENILPQTVDIIDTEVSKVDTKRGEKLEAYRKSHQKAIDCSIKHIKVFTTTKYPLVVLMA